MLDISKGAVRDRAMMRDKRKLMPEMAPDQYAALSAS